MGAYDFYIKRGDRMPFLYVTLEDANGPVNLTGATLAFNGRLQGSTALVADTGGQVVVDSAPGGDAHYEWGTVLTFTAGIYECEFEVTFANGKKLTHPNWKHLLVLVRDDVD